MKKLVLLLSIVAISLSAFTQEKTVPCTTDDTSADPVYVAVDTMPSFPGGNIARVKFLQDISVARDIQPNSSAFSETMVVADSYVRLEPL